MKLLNKDVDYAARALVFMARADRPTVSVAQMQASIGVTRPFLRKILQKLHTAGILQAIKGKGGGFALARRPETITLGTLVLVLQGELKLNNCVTKGQLCQNHPTCKLHQRIAGLEERLLADVQMITVRDLV